LIKTIIRMENSADMASCDIFIRSYYRDLDWLLYCLRSIELFCSGFRNVVVVVPGSSAGRLRRLGIPEVTVHICKDYDPDYLGQQITKLHADLYTDADYICHVDSDWIFTRPCHPSDLFIEGKLTIGMTSYADLPQAIPWKKATERFLGWEVSYDFMRRQPYSFPRWLYAALREHAEHRHARDIESYILSQPPLGFSEFNAMGAFAFFRHHEAFVWLDAMDATLPSPLCICYWSWGGLTPAIRLEMDNLLGIDDRGRAC
jgi:hypothetical protein